MLLDRHGMDSGLHSKMDLQAISVDRRLPKSHRKAGETAKKLMTRKFFALTLTTMITIPTSSLNA